MIMGTRVGRLFEKAFRVTCDKAYTPSSAPFSISYTLQNGAKHEHTTIPS